jgi:hypothetical protein
MGRGFEEGRCMHVPSDIGVANSGFVSGIVIFEISVARVMRGGKWLFTDYVYGYRVRGMYLNEVGYEILVTPPLVLFHRLYVVVGYLSAVALLVGAGILMY